MPRSAGSAFAAQHLLEINKGFAAINAPIYWERSRSFECGSLSAFTACTEFNHEAFDEDIGLCEVRVPLPSARERAVGCLHASQQGATEVTSCIALTGGR